MEFNYIVWSRRIEPLYYIVADQEVMTEPPEQIKELTFGSWEHPSVEGTPPSPRCFEKL